MKTTKPLSSSDYVIDVIAFIPIYLLYNLAAYLNITDTWKQTAFVSGMSGVIFLLLLPVIFVAVLIGGSKVHKKLGIINDKNISKANDIFYESYFIKVITRLATKAIYFALFLAFLQIFFTGVASLFGFEPEIAGRSLLLFSISYLFLDYWAVKMSSKDFFDRTAAPKSKKLAKQHFLVIAIFVILMLISTSLSIMSTYLPNDNYLFYSNSVFKFLFYTVLVMYTTPYLARIKFDKLIFY